jgi:hypothetical protein
MGIDGVSSLLSPILLLSGTNAELGGESAGGAGVPALEVTHKIPATPDVVVVHPAGNVGVVTPSKFSRNTIF